MKITILVVCAGMLGVLAGCSGREKGPERYQLSGNVTVDGKPAAAGTIMLTPDSKRGNQGPGALITFRDGSYKTGSGNGVIGGAYIAEVQAFDGISNDPSSEMGSPVTDLNTQNLDLPRANSVQDFQLKKK